jgi:hypothetical protein
MNPPRMTHRVIVTLAIGAGLGGCTETTSLREVMEMRVAHAAPGLGTQILTRDGATVVQLELFQSAYFPGEMRAGTYEFRGDEGNFGVQLVPETDLNAVILMNPADPTARHFPLERVPFGERLMVINGDFQTTEPLTVLIERTDGGFTSEVQLAPGENTVIDPGFGTFDLHVRPGSAGEFQELEGFPLVQGDNGFLVLLRLDSAGAEPVHTWMLF